MYDTTTGSAGEVNVYSYYDADKTGYTGVGWNTSTSGSGTSGLGSEKSKVTDFQGNVKQIDNKAEVDFTSADSLLQLYYFHFTYKTGDIYYGYGYNDSKTIYTTNQTLSSISGANGTYTIDYVYKSAYGTAGEVQVYSYYDAPETNPSYAGSGWQNTVTGSGLKGLGSESGSITNTIDVGNVKTGASRTFSSGTEADFVSRDTGTVGFGIQYYQFHFTFNAKALVGAVLSDNKATITTSGAHGYSVGDRISVDVDGQTLTDLNGTFTVTNVTSNTFSYALTHSPIASSAITGTVTKGGDTYYGSGYQIYTLAAGDSSSPYTVDSHPTASINPHDVGITNVALTNNVATITTSAAHGYSVGDSVTVDALNNTFDGTYTITAVTSATEFSYAKTYTGKDIADTDSGKATLTPNGMYTIDSVSDTDYGGSIGQVWVSSYTTFNHTNLVASALGRQGLGSELGSFTDANGTSKQLDNIGTNSTADLLQYYTYHFTYTTGDIYYGYGYHHYTTEAGGNSPYVVGSLGTFTDINHHTTLGTYTIDYVADTVYGVKDAVYIYSYNDVNGVGTKNSVTGFGSNDLGSEKGVVTDFSGAQESFNNYTNSVNGLTSTATLQYYQFHFTYASGGDTYYGYGYHSYTSTADAYTANQNLSVTGALGTYTIDYAYDTTYGTPDQVSVYQYTDGNAITNVELSNKIATITTASAHGYHVGDTVAVNAFNNTFDGTYTVTGVTSTTFSYATTYAGTIASASDNGSTNLGTSFSLGKNNLVSASGSNGLGSESGTVTDFGGEKEAFDNTDSISTLHSTLYMQFYQFHFVYNDSGDTYYGYGYNTYKSTSIDGMYTVNEHPVISGAQGTYTIDSVYDTTYGNPNQVFVNSYYDNNGVGYVGVGGLGFGGLGSEKGFVFTWEKNTNTVAMFNSASDAHLSALTQDSTNPAANYVLIDTNTSSPGINNSSSNTAGPGVDIIRFLLPDNTTDLSLSNATGFDIVDLGNDQSTTYKLKINFDDVYRSDNQMMLITGAAFDDTIELSTKSSVPSRADVTWNNIHQSIYDGNDGYYYDIWQGSDRDSSTSDVTLLIRQNMQVNIVDPTSTQFFKFHYTYASGDVYSGTGYAAAGTYLSGQTISFNKTITNVALTSNVATITTSTAHGYHVGDTVTVDASNDNFDGTYTVTGVTSTTFSYAKTYTGTITSSATGSVNAGTYTIDGVTSKAGTAGTVNILNYQDVDGVGPNNTITAGSGTGGLGSETGTVKITHNGNDVSVNFTTGAEADFVQKYNFHFTYNTGDIYEGYVYADVGRYSVGQTLATSLTGSAGTYTIDSITAAVGKVDQVTLTRYNDVNGAGYTSSLSGSGSLGLGSESGSVTNADGLVRQFNTKSEADFIASNFSGHYAIQYYQFHFTYNTASGRAGETYSGGGYNLYTTETTDSLSPYAVNQHPTIANAQGTYTIDSVSDTNYGTPGQVYFYNYTTANGTYLNANGNGYQGLGSEKGSVTNASGVTSAINNTGTTSASLMQYYQFHFTYTDGDSYTGYGYHNYTKAANDAYIVNQNPNISNAQGIYTIDYVYDTTYGTPDQVYVYQYNDASTSGVGTSNSATGFGFSGLGSESGTVTDFSGTQATFDKTTSVNTLHSTANLQQYSFHFTYASGGDTYYGSGYHSYTSTADAYNTTTNLHPSVTGALGTYTIDYAYDTTYGTPDQVSVYQYNDSSTNGVGSNNSVTASGTHGLGSESGTVTDFSGTKETFDNTDSVNTLNSTAKLQQYQFHFSYTAGGDVYYGSGYHAYSSTTDMYTMNQSITTSYGQYTIDAAYDTTWGVADHVSIRNYYDKDGIGYVGGGGAGVAGLGSETGFIFGISDDTDKRGAFNATSDADLSSFATTSTSSNANEKYTATTPDETVAGGGGIDQLSFNVADNTSISLSHVTGIDFINLKQGADTTQHLKINFDDVFHSDNKIMAVVGQPYDDIIDLNTQGGSVTWTLSNDIQPFTTPDNNYLQVWQGRDSNSTTSDVILLLQQNILVNQVAA